MQPQVAVPREGHLRLARSVLEGNPLVLVLLEQLQHIPVILEKRRISTEIALVEERRGRAKQPRKYVAMSHVSITKGLTFVFSVVALEALGARVATQNVSDLASQFLVQIPSKLMASVLSSTFRVPIFFGWGGEFLSTAMVAAILLEERGSPHGGKA